MSSTGSGQDDLARVAELASETNEHVTHQHVVSKVLLKQFAMPTKKGSGLQVQPYDLRHLDRLLKTRAPRGLCQVENFVSYASGSLEAQWGEVERGLPYAFAAVKHGTALSDSRTDKVLRDLIALHYVRSQHYREVFHRVFDETYREQRRWLLTEGREILQVASWQRTGLYAPGPQALDLRADEVLRPTVEAYLNGALFRVRIEDNFRKARQFAAQSALQILEPEDGEFLIGDNPALTMRYEGDHLLYGMALGDSHTTVLPIGPRHALALAPANEYVRASKAAVDQINVLQIKAARRYVYTRPGSRLAELIRRVGRLWTADHVQQEAIQSLRNPDAG